MMRKLLFLTAISITLIIGGCNGLNEGELEYIHPDDLITMGNLDEYMFRDDVQYVDLRNYEAVFHSGFIYSFEIIPFFDYLDYRAFDRNDAYEFEPDQILNSALLENIFIKDKAIFLYADGCIRGGYLKDVLNYLGYERVYVIGGFYEYSGLHKVLGDATYTIGNTFYNSYFDEENDLQFYVFGSFDMGRKILSIRFDVIDELDVSIRTPDYDLENEYNIQLNLFEDFILIDSVTINELYYSLSNLEDSGYIEVADINNIILNGIIQLINELKAE